MTTTPDHPGAHDLRAVLGAAQREVDGLLAADGHSPLAVVSWLSAHLAALDQAVYPESRCCVPGGEELIANHRTVVKRAMRLLRVIERHHSGDILASALDGGLLERDLRVLLDELRVAENALIDGAVHHLPLSVQHRLIADYHRALVHAPTRPHPHLSHAGPLTRLLFWLDAKRDRALDTMDGRHVSVPRVRRQPRPPGRWSSYLLGQQQPPKSGNCPG